ncbi:unnamed protein product [Chondrus crispus]|uniref:Uncharacterized protein n=1 Tax=Chondrus crispus TaxID=2769 RepID=R7QHJ6_CHOCR|nr:unnamed protein product [Chondrus crispus]CDF37248.1 unnamed protein product [Chondrus crispus]|eukprot:XP_005717067.1 unnamed protein product [Chondrus crispus]
MSSPSASPRGSDISFSSVHSTLSNSSPSKHPPVSLTADSPPCVSTSTISRSSASASSTSSTCPTSPVSPVATFAHSISSHLLEPISSSGLPKARVFVERRPQTAADSSADRPRANSAHPRRLPGSYRPQLAINTVQSTHARRDPRCVSDLHEAFRARRGAAWEPVTSSLQSDEPPVLRDAETLSEEARGYLSEDDASVPSWLPEDERRDWTSSETIEPEVDFEDEEETPSRHDPCEEEAVAAKKWIGSLRNLSHLGRRGSKKENLPMRGSILDIRPPTVRERFGVRSKRRKGRDFWGERECNKEDRADEYVGFLLKADVRQEKKVKKVHSWLRVFRRSQ